MYTNISFNAIQLSNTGSLNDALPPFNCCFTLVEIICSINSKKAETLLIYLNFTKAFDKLNHNLLKQRILSLNLDKTFAKLLADYLTER